jgi:hypothetical protein
MRILSSIALVLAVSSAFVVLALDCLHPFAPFLESWRLKSAFPLLFVGISYACLQFTSPRSWKEFALGLSVGIAFMLWGAEQFVPFPAVRAWIDDGVMFLFVLDLSIVIRRHLVASRARAGEDDFP